jgi:hypothetical protein
MPPAFNQGMQAIAARRTASLRLMKTRKSTPVASHALPRQRWLTLFSLAGILILLLFSNAFAQTDFPAFWTKFKSAVAAGDKSAVAGMTKFPLSMPYVEKSVKDRADFLRRYNQIFNGEANAAQCFASAKPTKESARRYEFYCPFKGTPNDWENAPVLFYFELTETGWKFAGLDNINE